MVAATVCEFFGKFGVVFMRNKFGSEMRAFSRPNYALWRIREKARLAAGSELRCGREEIYYLAH